MNIFETEFAAYLSAKKSGQRKEAMKALNAFLEDCKKLDLDAERKVAADFFKWLDAVSFTARKHSCSSMAQDAYGDSLSLSKQA